MSNQIQLKFAGTITLDGAEISDFDPKTKRLFLTGEVADKPVLQVVDISDPSNPTKIGNTDLSTFGAGIQSVAVRKGTTGNSIVAVAISAANITEPGKVVFFDATVDITNPIPLAQVAVGALPDMLTFSPDGTKLLVANEGEPSEDYTIDPEGSISIIDVSGNIGALDNTKVATATFTAFNAQEASLKQQGVRIFGKLANGTNSTVAQDLEPEYIAFSGDSKTAFVTLQDNNAFAKVDIATATVTDILPLGFKDHSLPGNGIDASDRDSNINGGINIKNYPIFGMYQPDAIASFESGGKTYYVTANEGDSRIRPTEDDILPAPNDTEGSIFNEEVRIGNDAVVLDPTAFPNATELKNNANLGRLTITNTLGDTDGDGDYDKLYAYGARSFSIWDDTGKLVFDSGDQFEQITAAQTPTLFNANDGVASQFDTRSDNKGPEPEAVTIGYVNGKAYAFIGLERAGGGVMVYDLSNPTNPKFVQYIRTEGDISPEGLKFISAADSPNGKPLLAVANEVSKTTTLYAIETPNSTQITNYTFNNLPKLGTTSTGQDILLGGFSGLYFQGIAANGNLKFVTHTDRGPNGEPTAEKRPFLLPNFQPEVVSFEVNRSTSEITITKRTGLFRQDGTTPLTGLPNLQPGAANTAYTDEVGVDLNGNILPNDTLGADLEGIVVAENGDFWMVDEYRPAIYHFDSNGKLIDRFIPLGDATDEGKNGGTSFGTPVIPAVYAQRRANRGFEAVALEGRKLYAFIQSAIDNPDNGGDTVSRASRNLRILEFDIVSKQVTGEYLYLLDDITASGNAKTDKIGDAVALGNGKFAVVERDDLSTTASNKLIYQIDLAEATNINNPANFTLPTGKTIEQLSTLELTAANIKPVSKSLIANAAQLGYTGVEKLEGLALVAPNTLALINDNDFDVTGTNTPAKLGILELLNDLPVAQTGLTKNSSNDVFNISGGVGIPRLQVSLIGSNSTFVNELCIFAVDDSQGRINGISPGQTGYTEAALERAKVVWSAIANNPNGFNRNELNRLLEFESGGNFRFLLVKNSSIDAVKLGKTSLSDVLFSSETTQKITFVGNNAFTLSWEDGTGNISDFKDLEVKVEFTNQQLPLGSRLQGNSQAELLDLRGISGNLKAEFTLYREAGFDNLVGFYKIANENGGIDTNNDGIADILPGQAGYIQAAINQRLPGVDLTVSNQGKATFNSTIVGGSLLAPFIIANGRPAAILDSNSNNDPAVYFPFLGANPGQVDHIRLLGNNTWGFEDLPLGGDKDYNDIVLQMKLTV
ncbi:choice-of-anchor I family protein [Calothrix sp. UHCC 0171]|uniref:choice-of-anchor I family protein n=1 Tax=Calothrix sp. UHCC 0171 TaxID=3110245 RepID=UPI002B2207D1|nr:choice-of-anchor I family protein [Calothrix sp. UHCC 0171]MEA5572294.1 choice-of-anchor I family protein [Calothrix sp. UHCC 0171]